jgi:hypothetical protein
MHRDKRIRVRGAPKREPDIRKLSRALLALAMAQAKAEQEAQAHAEQPPATTPTEEQPPRGSA